MLYSWWPMMHGDLRLYQAISQSRGLQCRVRGMYVGTRSVAVPRFYTVGKESQAEIRL